MLGFGCFLEQHEIALMPSRVGGAWLMMGTCVCVCVCVWATVSPQTKKLNKKAGRKKPAALDPGPGLASNKQGEEGVGLRARS